MEGKKDRKKGRNDIRRVAAANVAGQSSLSRNAKIILLRLPRNASRRFRQRRDVRLYLAALLRLPGSGNTYDYFIFRRKTNIQRNRRCPKVSWFLRLAVIRRVLSRRFRVSPDILESAFPSLSRQSTFRPEREEKKGEKGGERGSKRGKKTRLAGKNSRRKRDEGRNGRERERERYGGGERKKRWKKRRQSLQRFFERLWSVVPDRGRELGGGKEDGRGRQTWR